MSRQEQSALVAWINSFRPSRRITSFEHLADGRAFMELLSSVDPIHFKALPTRGPGAGPSSPDNWVLKINALKRIHRLLLSFSLPPPHDSLSTSTLPEPPFSAIVKSPTSPEGTVGLLLIARMVLCVAVWAPGNERVIAKIQGLGEAHMAELMRGIEEVMGSMPPEEEGDGDAEGMGGMMRLSRRGSPVKKEVIRASSPPGALRAERDRLSAENDELRLKVEQMADQVTDMTASLDEARIDRDNALERLATSRETGVAALRSSQGAGSDAASLKSDLAEEMVAKMQDDLSAKTAALSEMQTAMVALQEEAAEASKMKDQLDEYRHVQERLHKSENVIEKYKKKLDDSAAVRRELKNLEEENAQLLSINTGLENELRKVGQDRVLTEGDHAQIASLEAKAAEQAEQVADLSVQLETTRSLLHETETAHERDKEDLELYRLKVQEVELGSVSAGGGDADQDNGAKGGVKGSLDEELDGLTSPAETRTDLKLKIRRLERELATHTSSTSNDGNASTTSLESLLRDAQKARDRYQADYLVSSRNVMRLEARLDAILKGKEGTTAMVSALQVQLEDITKLNTVLEAEIVSAKNEEDRLSREWRDASEDLDHVGKDERAVLESLRHTARMEVIAVEARLSDMRDQIDALKERDRFRLEEIKTLLNQKVDLQSSSIDQHALREAELRDLRTDLARGELAKDTVDRLMSLISHYEGLRRGTEQLRSIAGQGPESEPDYSVFEEAQKSYESQISRLQSDLDYARAESQAAEKRYKLEQDLMLSAWHDLGSKVVREHLAAVIVGAKRSQSKPVPAGWLGRQRRWKEDAIFSR